VLNTLTAITDEPVPSARHVLPDLPEELDAIIKKALSKEPSDRFATAGEMQDALEEYLVGAREYVEQTRIALYLDSIFEEADKDPLPGRASRGTGSSPSLSSASGQSGSFGPFGQAPRVELTPSEVSIQGIGSAGQPAVFAPPPGGGAPYAVVEAPPADLEGPPRSAKRMWIIGLVVAIFIVLGVAAGMLTAFLLK
jgi:serine/threonine-protein kinase